MDKIKIQHPNLPDREPIEVAKSSLPFHINAGWEEVLVSPEEGGVPDKGDQVNSEEPKTPRRTSRRADNTTEDEV